MKRFALAFLLLTSIAYGQQVTPGGGGGGSGGAVSSVNGQTGAVSLSAANVGAAPVSTTAALTFGTASAAGTYYPDGTVNSGAQSAATALTACNTTITGGAGGVILFAEPSQPCAQTVKNRTGNPIDVWPVLGTAIDSRATNATAVIVSQGAATFAPQSAGSTAWVSQ